MKPLLSASNLTVRYGGKVAVRSVDLLVGTQEIITIVGHNGAGTLSGGEQQMLAIGMGLIVQPRVLLVDEPTIGLAPSLVKRVMADLADARSGRNCSVLLVEQNISESLAIADRAYGMRRGEFVAESKASEFTDRFDLMEIM